ncbi:hypothetical protein LXL04_022186 [Taraxacum kok-saghyz]
MFALVPLGSPLLTYRSNCKAMLTTVDVVVQLVVDGLYIAGQSVVVWCGPQPNSKLLINYGFVDDDKLITLMTAYLSRSKVSPCMEHAVLNQLASHDCLVTAPLCLWAF